MHLISREFHQGAELSLIQAKVLALRRNPFSEERIDRLHAALRQGSNTV
jgi:hypothetical protein